MAAVMHNNPKHDLTHIGRAAEKDGGSMHEAGVDEITGLGTHYHRGWVVIFAASFLLPCVLLSLWKRCWETHTYICFFSSTYAKRSVHQPMVTSLMDHVSERC